MFKNLFSFEGRIRRTEYGLSILISGIAFGITTVIAEAINSQAIIIFLLIPYLWFIWSQAAKRCHDLGHSGWWQLIPFYGLWLLFLEGEHGENQYGEDPKKNKLN